jgi:hypothetical protein
MTTLMGCLSLHLDSASAYDHGAERGRASGAGAQPVPRCHRSASRHPAAGWGGCVLVEERAMDTQDDQPKGPPPGDGTAQLPGWYPDPAGGWGQRWWDGARWTEQTTAAPPAAPPPALKPKGALEKVFQVEFVLAAIAIIPFFLTLLSSAGCMSDRCEDLVIMATLWSVGVQVLLVIVCGRRSGGRNGWRSSARPPWGWRLGWWGTGWFLIG